MWLSASQIEKEKTIIKALAMEMLWRILLENMQRE